MIKIKKEKFEKIIKESYSKAEVARKLGMNGVGGSSYRYVNSLIRLHDVSISHFTGAGHLRGKTHNWTKSRPLKEILIKNSDFLWNDKIKKKILKANLLNYECSNCKINEWLGKKLSLHLDHINGICNDNRIENLRFLCPNCHSQTETFCSKSKTIGRAKLKEKQILQKRKQSLQKQKECLDCNNKISKASKRCKSCASKLQPTKINWPPIEKLIEMVEESNYSATGRALGVSDNAIRKHIKKHA